MARFAVQYLTKLAEPRTIVLSAHGVGHYSGLLSLHGLKDIMTLEMTTQRLHMRQLRSAGFEAYATIYSNPETARFIGGQMDRYRAWRHMAAIVGHWTLKGFGIWAVEERSSGAFIGCVGLWEPAGWPEIELGYWIVPQMRGQGLAREASQKAREHAYSTMGLTTLVSYIDPSNEASKRLAERLGAWCEGIIDLAGLGPHCAYRHPPAT